MRSTSRRGLLDLLPRTQPRRSRACPLASHATAHVARVPSPRSPLLCPLTSHARTRALSALSLLAGTLSLSLRPRSALASRLARMLSHALSPRTQPRISHACPLCSQTRPLITPSPYALSRSPSRSFTTHACPLTRSYALSPRMHARVPSPLLSGTPSQHYALSRSPFAPSHHACMPSHALLRPALTSHACPLTRSHLACMPSLSSSLTRPRF